MAKTEDTPNAGSGRMPPAPRDTETKAVADIVGKHMKPEVVELKHGEESANVLVTASGLKIHGIKEFLEPYQTAPERRSGTAVMHYLSSLIDHAKRFQNDTSALFAVANRGSPKLVSVLDYHPAGPENDDAAFCRHRAQHDFPLSEEWLAWRKMNAEPMSQADFAAFLEDRISDVVVPDDALMGTIDARARGGDFGPKTALEILADYAALLGGNFATPSKLVELSRGLGVHASHQVKNAVNLDSGETQVQFVEEHADSQGLPIKVPNMFLIGIPVFRAGGFYRIAVRLRYRLGAGSITWFYQLYRHEVVFDAAFQEACELAKTETGLPLFYGLPEA
jgi:hypothetical protein